MKNIFLDTNVILDYIAQRQPFLPSVEKIFQLADEGKAILHCSALSFSTIFYVLRKLQQPAQLQQTLSDLSLSFAITAITEKTITDALKAGFTDLEDAIQYFSAVHFAKIDVIITRDPKGFKLSDIPILSPENFLKKKI